jgi:hypothetical protein
MYTCTYIYIINTILNGALDFLGELKFLILYDDNKEEKRKEVKKKNPDTIDDVEGFVQAKLFILFFTFAAVVIGRIGQLYTGRADWQIMNHWRE